jgi:hypothetical protein
MTKIEQLVATKQWMRLFDALPEGTTEMKFPSLKDIHCFRASAYRYNRKHVDEWEVRFVSIREEMYLGITKIRLKPLEKKLTGEDAERLALAEKIPLEEYTDEFIAGFKTESGRRRAAHRRTVRIMLKERMRLRSLL